MSEPLWLARARAHIGLHEGVGDANNKTIMGWAKRFGGWIASFYKADSIPWCGLFVGAMLMEAGIKPPANLLGARQYERWGQPLKYGAPGAIVTFARAGGGHVGFYVAEDPDAYHILGGNQSDAVNIKRIAKSRATSIRWPVGIKDIPGKRVFAAADGSLSTNEG